MMKYKWKEIAQKLQAIAQVGLSYSKDAFDRERFEQIREISVQIMSDFCDTDMKIVRDLFASEMGYQTPKVDIRAAVFKEDKILLVKEKDTQKWSLPGGWADVGLSPSENAVKEVKEEAGLDVVAEKILAFWDKRLHEHPQDLYHVYKIVILCVIKGGKLTPGIETKDADFFSKDALPELSTDRITLKQIHHIFNYLKRPDQKILFD